MPMLNSSAVKRAEYTPSTLTLHLWFPQNGPYDYYQVPESKYLALISASSPGTYYNLFIEISIVATANSD